MSSPTSALHTLNPSRIRSLVWPREHGAWGLLLVPLVTGAWIGHPTEERVLHVAFFALAALALFCLRTPVEACLEVSPLRPQTPAERKAIYVSIVSYASVAGAALFDLIWRVGAHTLLLLGAVAAAAFLAQAVLRKMGRETRLNSQWIGAMALTSTSAGAYVVACGRLDTTALVVWAANWLLAANQIHYVQVRIHSARATTRQEKFSRGQAFLLGEAFSVLLLAWAWREGWLPGFALLAFLPVFLRSVAWLFERSGRLEIHRLGISELVHAVTFGVLLIAGFHIHGG